MQDVADRCGPTVPGVLRHVGSKAGLLVAVLEHRDIEDARSLRVQLGVCEEQVPDEWSTGGPDGVGAGLTRPAGPRPVRRVGRGR
jgi:AcrR family transcriptional regulator